MTDDNKRDDDQDRKRLSDEEMEDVAGGLKIESQIGKVARKGGAKPNGAIILSDR